MISVLARIATGLALLGACGRDGGGSRPSLTIFLVDGMQQRVFADELAAGHLPHMQRMIDRGAYIVDGVTSFPSVSGYAYYPFLTGVAAPHSGILGVRWFDRDRADGNFRNYIGKTSALLNGDLAPDVPTLFELVPGDATTATNTFVTRGVKKVLTDELMYAVSTYGNAKEAGLLRAIFPGEANYAKGEAAAMQVAIDDLPSHPRIQWVTLPHPDAIFHFEGPCPEYAQLLREADELIGKYRAASVAAGTEAERIYAVISDHGGVPVTKHFDVAMFLAGLGIAMDRDQAVHLFDTELHAPLERYDDKSAIVAIQGNAMTNVYMRRPGVAGPAGWRTAPTRGELAAYPTPRGAVDLVATLRAQSGIGFVVVREADDRVGVYGARGVGEIQVIATRYAYRVVEGRDPLEVGALAGAGPHTAAEWLAGTHAGKYPDAVPRLGQYATTRGAGDLVLIAAPDYDLADGFEPVVGNFKGAHGGIDAAQFRVPFIIAGPGVAHVRIDAARAEDIGATLQALLHVRAAHAVEGDVLPIVKQ